MSNGKCRRCGAEMELMNFGFAGSDWECPNGPWGTRLHDSLDMLIHRNVPVIMGFLVALLGALVFITIAFSERVR